MFLSSEQGGGGEAVGGGGEAVGGGEKGEGGGGRKQAAGGGQDQNYIAVFCNNAAELYSWSKEILSFQ